MKFISREEQLLTQFRATPHADAIGPEGNLLLATRVMALQPVIKQGIDDTLLDGTDIEPINAATHWVDENDVHHARLLSQNVTSTRGLLGPQVIAVRDDVRKLSHIVVIETDSLVATTFRNRELASRSLVHRGHTHRAHIALRKYDGRIFVLHASASNAGAARRLFMGDTELETVAQNVDFPFMAFSQSPIGHVPTAPPSFALLAYKCRETHKIFIRRMEGDRVLPEQILSKIPSCLGGVSFAISENKVLFSLDAIVDGKLVPMTASSVDGGRQVSDFSPVDLSSAQVDYFLPSSSPPFVDYLGNIQIPCFAAKGNKVHTLDVIGDSIVDALEVDKDGYCSGTLVAFPKKPPTETVARGITDGMGIIATSLSDGRLYVSNSQASGLFFPKERLLNNEMPRMGLFKATECCYTRGERANRVSMDYIYFEADEFGTIVSPKLYIETWDMPLPTPRLDAVSRGTSIEVNILADAWFEVGKTTFELSDPGIEIKSVRIVDGRKAFVDCDTDRLAGVTIGFTTKNTFYFHEGSAAVYSDR